MSGSFLRCFIGTGDSSQIEPGVYAARMSVAEYQLDAILSDQADFSKSDVRLCWQFCIRTQADGLAIRTLAASAQQAVRQALLDTVIPCDAKYTAGGLIFDADRM